MMFGFFGSNGAGITRQSLTNTKWTHQMVAQPADTRPPRRGQVVRGGDGGAAPGGKKPPVKKPPVKKPAKKPPKKGNGGGPKTGVIFDPYGRFKAPAGAMTPGAAKYYGIPTPSVKPGPQIDPMTNPLYAAQMAMINRMQQQQQQQAYASAYAPSYAPAPTPAPVRRRAVGPPPKREAFAHELAPEGKEVPIDAPIMPLYSGYAQKAYEREIAQLEENQTGGGLFGMGTMGEDPAIPLGVLIIGGIALLAFMGK